MKKVIKNRITNDHRRQVTEAVTQKAFLEKDKAFKKTSDAIVSKFFEFMYPASPSVMDELVKAGYCTTSNNVDLYDAQGNNSKYYHASNMVSLCCYNYHPIPKKIYNDGINLFLEYPKTLDGTPEVVANNIKYNERAESEWINKYPEALRTSLVNIYNEARALKKEREKFRDDIHRFLSGFNTWSKAMVLMPELEDFIPMHEVEKVPQLPVDLATLTSLRVALGFVPPQQEKDSKDAENTETKQVIHL